MKKQTTLVLAISLLWMSEAHANRDRDSWKKPLHDKAVSLEKQIRQRHDIVGSYPSMVQLVPPKHYAGSQQGAWKKLIDTGMLPPGWIVDHGTTGVSNIAHTSSWTGCYLTGQAFCVAFMKEKYGADSPQYREASARASELIHALRVLTLVTGQPGYLARGVALGHGIGYEERGGTLRDSPSLAGFETAALIWREPTASGPTACEATRSDQQDRCPIRAIPRRR